MIIMPFAAPALRHKRDCWQLPAPDCRSTLPEKIVAKLDFRSLKQLSGSYMSGELDQTMSDVVYSCRRKDRKGELEISLLVEHKSYRDNQTPLQIGSYLFSAYWQQVKQDKKQLTPIIPILFYHGKDKWEYWTLNKLFDDPDPDLLGFIPNFAYIYNNLHIASDEEIRPF